MPVNSSIQHVTTTASAVRSAVAVSLTGRMTNYFYGYWYSHGLI